MGKGEHGGSNLKRRVTNLMHIWKLVSALLVDENKKHTHGQGKVALWSSMAYRRPEIQSLMQGAVMSDGAVQAVVQIGWRK